MASDLDNAVTFQEWKSCQQTLGSLDKILVDLRKYGFSLVTILLSADGFLFAKDPPDPWIIVGISAALLILIAGLFRQDRVHEVFIRGAALRAMRLEKAVLEELSMLDRTARQPLLERGGLGLSTEISYWSETINTGTWGLQLYVAFCVAVATLGTVGITVKASDPSPEAIAAVVVISAVAIGWIFASHMKAISFKVDFRNVVDQRARELGLRERPKD